MKVLVVTNMYPTDDQIHAGAFVKSQMDSIRKLGIDMEIININEKRGIKKYPWAWWQVFRKSFDKSFDLIHAHYSYSGIISFLQWNLPVLVSFCGGDVLGNPNKKGKVNFTSKLFLPAGRILSLIVPAVIVKSKEMKKKLPRKHNVFVIPNGVNFEKFRPILRKQAREKCGLDFQKKYVLFPSNPSWVRKGYPVAEKAIEILQKKGIDVELVILYGKPHEVVPLYMNACDAMVLTSLWEGSPNVVKEAMACNLPVVTVPAGDAAEIVHGCKGCFTVKRDAVDISRKLEIILRDSKRTNGRQHISHLEESEIAKKIINIYKKIRKKK